MVSFELKGILYIASSPSHQVMLTAPELAGKFALEMVLKEDLTTGKLNVHRQKPKIFSSITVLYESSPPSLSKFSSSLNGSHVIFPSERICSLEMLSKCWTFFLTYSTRRASCSASVRSLL